jgi:hypothetical protein
MVKDLFYSIVELTNNKKMIIALLSEYDPGDNEWNEFVNNIIDSRIDRLVVISMGGKPNAKQRKVFFDKINNVKYSISLITECESVRVVLNVFNWFTNYCSVKFFAPDENFINHLNLNFNKSDVKIFEKSIMDIGMNYKNVNNTIFPSIILEVSYYVSTLNVKK